MGSSGQDQEDYCLHWNDFEANITSAFRDMRNDLDFCDVRLAVKDKASPLKAHKVVLASCSPYFKDLLKEMKNDNQTMACSPFYIMMSGVTSSTLNGILDFMYYGEVNVAQEDLERFLSLADELQVKGLMSKNSQGRVDASATAKVTPSKRRVAPPATSAMPSTTHSAPKRARTTAPPSTTSANTTRIVIAETQDTTTQHQDQYDDFDFEEGAAEVMYRGAEGTEGFKDDLGEGTASGGRAVNYDDDKDVMNEGIEKQGGKYACLVCNYKSEIKCNTVQHFLTQHTPQPKAVCPLCQKVYKNTQTKDVHIRNFHGLTKKMLMKVEGASGGPDAEA